MARYCLKWLDMAKNGWKCQSGNGRKVWKWLDMDGNGDDNDVDDDDNDEESNGMALC